MGIYQSESYKDRQLDRSDDNILSEIDQLCRNLGEIFDLIKKSDWLSNRTKILRYEDLAREPFEMAGKIFNFSEMDLHSNIREWISKNTKNSTAEDNSMRYKFSTSRNSESTAFKWKDEILYFHAEIIQKLCSDQEDSSIFTTLYKILK